MWRESLKFELGRVDVGGGGETGGGGEVSMTGIVMERSRADGDGVGEDESTPLGMEAGGREEESIRQRLVVVRGWWR